MHCGLLREGGGGRMRGEGDEEEGCYGCALFSSNRLVH